MTLQGLFYQRNTHEKTTKVVTTTATTWQFSQIQMIMISLSPYKVPRHKKLIPFHIPTPPKPFHSKSR